MGDEPHPLDIPAVLRRDANNIAEFMRMANDSVSNVTETKPKAAKANGHAKVPAKAAGKPSAKAAGKVPAKAKAAPKATAKAAKASEKAKAPAKAAKAVAEKDAYGFRKGSAKSKAVAMYARKNGATLAEVKDALGSVQLNVLVALEADGKKVERITEERKGQRAVTRYILKA